MTKERPYVEKTVAMFTGLFVKANLFESAPAALSGLIVRYIGAVKTPAARYIIDPVTYVFGLTPDGPDGESALCHWKSLTEAEADRRVRQDYRLGEVEPIPTGRIRTSEQLGKVEALLMTRSYSRLADKILCDPLRRAVGLRAFERSDFADGAILDDFVGSVIDYQRGALKRCFEGAQYQELGVALPEPTYVLSPYFRIESKETLEFMSSIWCAFDDRRLENGAVVAMVSKEYFTNCWQELASTLLTTDSSVVMLWIPELKEESATRDDLVAFGRFVQMLAHSGRSVVNLYGGGFSMSLLSYGLAGLINGPGYGLQRNAIPIKGGAPAASFYIPTSRVRKGILDALRDMMDNPAIQSKQDFLDHVCSCPICRAAMSEDPDEKNYPDAFWNYYGELVPSRTPGSNRQVPSKATSDREAFHFLLARLLEFRTERHSSPVDALERLRACRSLWRGRSGDHLDTWIGVLSDLESGE